MPKSYKCRHCEEEFIPLLGKPGFIDECVECLVAKEMAARPKPPSQLEQLLAYVAAHPVTVELHTGKPIIWKTRHELKQKLERKGFSAAIVDKLLTAYMAVCIEA
jgi:hypothetical protein